MKYHGYISKHVIPSDTSSLDRDLGEHQITIICTKKFFKLPRSQWKEVLREYISTKNIESDENFFISTQTHYRLNQYRFEYSYKDNLFCFEENHT